MPPIDFEYKTINDPVHGSIKVSKVELNVINTPSFQRLRGLKQLGLADFVFPGASHTRFAHSIGTMYIASSMINAINNNFKKKYNYKAFNDIEKQKIRLAALLHDIGHFPLSHSMEHPIQRIIREADDELIAPKKEGISYLSSFGDIDDMARFEKDDIFSHEEYGSELLGKREDLKKALQGFNDNNEIGNIFTKSHTNLKYSQFVSGTFDADRIDFLLRDSLAAGVSYGNIDFRYLLDNMNYDKEKKCFYIDYGGIGALEHYILARYFLYNITYHKTVMGFELMAKYAYYKMSKEEKLQTLNSKDDFMKIAENDGLFIRLNDDYFWDLLCRWKPSSKLDEKIKKSLLYRDPLSELYEERLLVTRSDDKKNQGKLSSRIYSDKRFDSLLRGQKLRRKNLAILTNNIRFEKITPTTKYSESRNLKKEWELCKVFYNGKIQNLIDIECSIIAKLSEYDSIIRRLYYLPEYNKKPDRTGCRRKIDSMFN